MGAKTSHGGRCAVRLRAPRSWGRFTPWGVSLLAHMAIAAAAALVAMTVVPGRAGELTAPGSILAPQSCSPIATIPRAPAAASVPQAMPQVARNAEITHLQPVAAPLDLAGLGASASRAAGAFGAAFRAPPRSSLLGAGGNAAHVVYVIDRSGSMIDTFQTVRREVLLSIGRLDATQDFHVILFAQGRAIENAPARLVPPTADYKLQAADFLAAARAGFDSDPVPALRRAFDVLGAAGDGGKLIYLLTDGVFPDTAAVMNTLRTRNKNKDVHINTYFCGGGDATAEATLQAIARTTGGLFRCVDGEAEQP